MAKKRAVKRTIPKGLWKRILKQELKQGDTFKKALKDAKKRYAAYKRTGKLPKII